MADLFQLGNLGVADDNSSLSTGDLRRKYNFGSRVSELAIAQDPFFRLVSKLSKKPTDDPQFKFTERRPSFHKRYGYVYGAADSGTPAKHGALTANTTKLIVAGDYLSQGNKGSVYGATAIEIGSTGTKPEFFVVGQLIKVPASGTLGSTYADYGIFWPSGGQSLVDGVNDNWRVRAKNRGVLEARCEWIPTLINPSSGLIEQGRGGGLSSIEGYFYNLTPGGDGQEKNFMALPSRCPGCGEDYKGKKKNPR